MWPDNDTTEDLIGSRVHADLIRGVVTDRQLLPVTVGVFGDWGGGKTSILRMVQRDLDPERWPEDSVDRRACENVACLYFNGWLFEGYDDAKAAVISAVLMSLGEHKRFGPKVRDRVATLLKSVNWMRAASLGLKHVALPAATAYVTGGASLLPTLGGALSTAVKGGSVDWADLVRKDEGEVGPLDVRSFRASFAQLLRDSDIDALVVLVDDLDRCSPERLIENLEAIKLFLNVEGTAFVVGADPRIVRHAIAWRYGSYGTLPDADKIPQDGGRLIDDYLEKLIQVPYRLPRLSPAEVQTYMTLLFCRLHLGDAHEAAFKAVNLACENRRREDRYRTFGAADVTQALRQEQVPANVREGLEAGLSMCAAVAPLVTEGLKGNPRQVKRFLNALTLRKRLAEVARLTGLRDDVLVKLMVLEYHDISVARFTELFNWQATQDGHPVELADLERDARGVEPNDAGRNKKSDSDKSQGKTAEWSTPFLRNWLRLDPALADVDLRDYFWVARDRLESTLSQVTLVPPVVRQLAEQLLKKAGRAAAATAAKVLDAEERNALLTLVEQHVVRRLDDKDGYDALRALVEADLPGAAERLARILAEQPAVKMPAAVGPDVATLLRKKVELKSLLQPAVDRLRETDAKIGKAIKNAK